MSKVIKIKETNLYDLINTVILEQATAMATKEVPVSGEIGTLPTYDGLKTLLKTLKVNVEKELRGEIPYTVKNNGFTFSRNGNALEISVTLEQSAPEARYWYFDVAAAVYSYATDNASLKSALQNKLADKAKYFGGSDTKYVLKTKTIQLSDMKGIDPKNPDKQFFLYIGSIVGTIPEGMQNLQGKASGEFNTETLKTGDTLVGIRSTDNQQYTLKIGEGTYKRPEYTGYSVAITGAGVYEGKKLDGTAQYDLTTNKEIPGTLGGNTEMGSYKIISYNGKQVGDVAKK